MQLNVLQEQKRNIHSDRKIKNQSQEEINYKEISPRAQLTQQRHPAELIWADTERIDVRHLAYGLLSWAWLITYHRADLL